MKTTWISLLSAAAALGLGASLFASCSATNADPSSFATGGSAPTGPASGSTTGAGGSLGAGGNPGVEGEVCGDSGQDNNGNGLAEEGCSCTEGQNEGCWTGPAIRRHVGICRDGVQICEKYGEFIAWGACNGEVLPQAEIEGNGIDEDCDGIDQGGGPCSPSGEICDNHADEDCDGLVDCADPDCADQCPSCIGNETGHCTNGLDDDCDGFIDCVDPDCANDPACMDPPPPPGCVVEFPFFAEIKCADTKDNDCDSKIDCADSDCLYPGSCGCLPKEANCTDGLDEDCDGQTDCADADCQNCTPGSNRWCDDPTYCHWGKQECGPDGHWGTCFEVMEAPAGCLGELYSAQCCVEAGECCQNYPVDQSSIGNCVGVSGCP